MDHTDDLVEHLLAVAGAVMEDASAAALCRRNGIVRERLSMVRAAAEDALKVVAAVEVIQRRVL